ncbi:hypothetical protein [Stenotrophomonas sp.]|uniref:hypothetical protein n=1 Tax=Stenotrophomonas sp. TaxID=69392 RepID=UPI002D6C1E1E|nr:hypothetical protein [Stenotrophomonas sp.]HYQ22874.1 hypothetical protein [Stenotrophomonas sp.]
MIDPANENQGTAKAARKRTDWPALVVVLTFVVTVGGVIMYWIGSTTRSAYLAELGIPAGGFALAREGLLELGAAALVDMVPHYPALLGDRWLLATILSIAAGSIVTCNLWPAMKRRKKAQVSPKVRAVVLGGVTASILPMVSIMVSSITLLVIALPAEVGNRAGVLRAQELRYQVCTPAASEPCIELWSGERWLGCGVVVAESATRIAFLDHSTRQTSVMDIQGLRSIGVVVPRNAKPAQELCTGRASVDPERSAQQS